jgi:hypothetical protein
MSRRSAPLPSLLAGLAATATLAGPAVAASGLPTPVVGAGYELRPVGAGDLSWLGRPIYRASLWTGAGRYTGFAPGEPVALSLWYQRRFSREDLVRITSTAWRMMGSVPKPQREQWSAQLRALWRDVAPGDNLTTVLTPGGATRFYDQDRFLGQVEDPAFGPAFLAIWLDERSVVRDLRVRLVAADAAVARR